MMSVSRLKRPDLESILAAAAQVVLESSGIEAATDRESGAFSLQQETLSLAVQLIASCLAECDVQSLQSRTAVDCRQASFTQLQSAVQELVVNELSSNTLNKAAAAEAENRQDIHLTRALLLMDLYERSLEYRIVHRDDRLELLALSQNKKRKGQYYTPLSLARKTAAIAFHRLFAQNRYREIDQVKRLKVLDPAMGGGVFLLCALEILESHCREICDTGSGQDFSRSQLSACLYGVDVDPIACQVTSLALWLFCHGDRKEKRYPQAHFSQNIRCADALLSSLANREVARSNKETNEKTKKEQNLFLWDEEFPHVFSSSANEGFDIVVSNPPWESAKPNSQEFFSTTTPDFRKLSKQEALTHTQSLLESEKTLKEEWQSQLRTYKKQAEFVRGAGARSLFPAKGQSDINVYKLFLDLGFSLLKEGGSLAMIVPSGILVDKGAVSLRKRLLSQGQLFQVQSFINSDRTFKIHPAFTYSILGVERGGRTSDISVSLRSTNREQSALQFTYQQKDISILSPKWLALFDISHPKDLEVLKKIHSAGTPLGSRSSNQQADWNHRFKREFDMTVDSHLFVAVDEAEAKGFRADIFGNWLQGGWQPLDPNEPLVNLLSTPNMVASADSKYCIALDKIADVLLPLYEGRMVGQFDYSEKSHRRGSGRTAVWEPSPLIGQATENGSQDFASLLKSQTRAVRPHFLVRNNAKDSVSLRDESLKLGYLAVGSAINVRTMLASALFRVPCGNSVPVLQMDGPSSRVLALTACLNSFVFDYALRMRMTGNNLNYFILQECPLPQVALISKNVSQLTAVLNLVQYRNAEQWLQFAADGQLARLPAIPTSESQRLHYRALIDVLVADAYGLSENEFAWILRGCEHESPARNNGLHNKGFWRVGKNQPAKMRLPNLALESFRELRAVGMEQYLAHNLAGDSPDRTIASDDVRALERLSNNLRIILSLH